MDPDIEDKQPESSLQKEMDSLMGSLNGLLGGDKAVTLTKRPVFDGDLDRLINQCIHGLLSKADLTSNELILLDALMKGRKK